MARRRGLERKLAALEDLRADPTSDRAVEQLRRALASKTSFLVGRAAQIAAEFEMQNVEPDIVRTFERLMINPAKTDPGCQAKQAVADALYRLDSVAEDVFLRGVRHVQMESTWGGKVDTAAGLRGACALGLVRMGYPQVMIELAHLLADPDRTARISAVRAIGYTGQPAGVPLLRFKVLSSDVDLEVICECFGALLQLDPESSLPFVGSYLQSDHVALAEAAALALGESRLPGAFEVLGEGWGGVVDAGLRSILLRAVAMLRTDKAIDFLLALIAEESATVAENAIVALGVYGHDEELRWRVRETVEGRNDIDLNDTVAEMFG